MPKAQRAWLTQVYRGNASSDPQVAENYKEARKHLFRIGYKPASEEVEPARRQARKGIGSDLKNRLRTEPTAKLADGSL